MTALFINVDPVAMLRQASQETTPDPIAGALLAEIAGVDGVVCHLHEDRRHIQDRDLRLLRKTIQTQLILEMAATSEMVGIALDVRPERVTLFPESDTDTAGKVNLDLIVHNKSIAETVGAIQSNGIPVSLFIAPEPEQIKLAHQVGTDGIHINTYTFCSATGVNKRRQAMAKIVDAVKLARKLKLTIFTGHGLDYTTIKAFKGLSEVEAYSIGHAIISRAVLVGIDRAVREMRALIDAL
ncbi:Pyridoxine 5'-phosphate synthase [Desulfosarcina cetonica]|uniref:pyridoxine 5'-phosphate synthase n=1 Tax=Desulfosarcina cetonica TaxID=90730 RepID=UPI0006D121D4|nr:pyridoxine 5'-phosphate synthase [Desulfosarcina cetonica]VTR65384.1 Pyridoxine 5'-phosphate synthase [Desulfosarcina cetonica]